MSSPCGGCGQKVASCYIEIEGRSYGMCHECASRYENQHTQKSQHDELVDLLKQILQAVTKEQQP